MINEQIRYFDDWWPGHGKGRSYGWVGGMESGLGNLLQVWDFSAVEMGNGQYKFSVVTSRRPSIDSA